MKSKAKGPANIPRSLNIGQRKRENERIERENHAFAQRLFGKQSSISKRKHDDEYRNHIKYRNQIQKV